MRIGIAAALSLAIALCPAAAAERDGVKPFAYVTVVGAPGDGDQALAEALGRQLAARGLEPATAVQADVYEVQGTVRVAPAAKGKETVAIVWVVLGPDGKQLGITRQTKTVRKGSLAKTWGKAADAAAGAAAEDIAKLVPR
jgi:mRNA-degrading endonuclease toxin of MazEF toxin-antitoxin module